MDTKDTKPILFDNKKEIEERMKKFDELMKYVKSYLQVVHENLIAEVAGGIRQYINLFFTKGCIHHLNTNNSQFMDLLNIFRSIQKLLDTLRSSMLSVEQLQYNCQVKEDQKLNECAEFLENRIEFYQNHIDDLAVEIETVNEQTDMDNLLAEARDDMESDDEDWD